MTSIATQLRRYPVVAVTLGVGLVGLLLELVGPADSARWVISAYALVIAAVDAWSMVKKLLRGHAGLDVLAVAAILATVAVAEYWASLVIVLMLSGGEALEQYAGYRARRELRALLDRAPLSAHRLIDGDVVTGGPDESVTQPRWSPAGTLHWISDRSGWWNLYCDGDACRSSAGAAMPC